jgi:hypothetical protein
VGEGPALFLNQGDFMINAVSDDEFGLNGCGPLAGFGKMGDRKAVFLGAQENIKRVLDTEKKMERTFMSRCTRIDVNIDGDVYGAKFSAKVTFYGDGVTEDKESEENQEVASESDHKVDSWDHDYE